MRSALPTAFALLALAGASSAQIPDLPTFGSSWLDHGYPRLYYTPTNGVAVGLYYAQFRPLGYDDWDAPQPYRANIALDGLITSTGTRRLGLEAKFPSLVPGWRFDMRLWTERQARQNYFGIGNETEFDKENISDLQAHFYRLDRHRLFARGSIQKSLVSDLRALVGFHVERWRLDTLPGPTLYGDQVVAGSAEPPGQATDEASIRLGLVFDSRDDEVSATRGTLIEAIYSRADSMVGGDVSYERITASAAGYVTPTERLTLAGRVVAQAMGGSPPPGTYYLVEASGTAYQGLGGPTSHRALRTDRFLGEDKLFGNLDIRYRFVGERHVFSATLVGFLDVGRVFQPGEDQFEVTLDGMHVGAGLGPLLMIGRSGVLGWTLAVGPDGLTVQTHLGWTF